MSFEERNTFTYLFISLLVALLFGSRIYDGTLSGTFDGPEGLKVWARTLLWYIPAAIALTIAAVILVSIVYGMVTGDHDMSTDEDERDKSIGLRGARVTVFFLSLGWILCIISLALGWTALAALNLMLFFGWFADFAANLFKIYRYRRGF